MKNTFSVVVDKSANVVRFNKVFLEWKKRDPESHSEFLTFIESNKKLLSKSFIERDEEAISTSFKKALGRVVRKPTVYFTYQSEDHIEGIVIKGYPSIYPDHLSNSLDIFSNIGSFEYNTISKKLNVSDNLRELLNLSGDTHVAEVAESLLTKRSLERLKEFSSSIPAGSFQLRLELKKRTHGHLKLLVVGESIWSNDQPLFFKGLIYNSEEIDLSRLETRTLQSIELLYQANIVANVGFWDFNLDTGTVLWDETTRKIHDVAHDFNPTLENAIQFYPKGEHRKKISELVENCIKSGTPYTTDALIRNAKGKDRWVKTSGQLGLIDGERHIYGLFQDITSQASQKQELTRLSLAVKNLNQGVVVTDAKGLITYVNSAVERITGYRKSELLGKKPGSILQGEGTDLKTVSEIRRALADYKPIRTEILNYAKSGQPYWAEINISAYKNEKGQVIGFIGIQNNITQEKKQKKEIRFLNDILSGVQAPAFVFSQESKITWKNKSFDDLLSSADTLIPEFMHEGSSLDFKDLVKLSRDNSKLTLNLEINGKIHNYEARFAPTEFDGNKYTLCILNNIDQEVEFIEKIQNQRERLNYIVEVSDLGVFSYNLDSKTIITNQRFHDILGRSVDKNSNKLTNLYECFKPEDAKAYKKNIEALTKGQIQSFSEVFEATHSNGQKVWIQDQSQIFGNNHVYGIRRDVSHEFLTKRLFKLMTSLDYDLNPLDIIYDILRHVKQDLEFDFFYIADIVGNSARIVVGEGPNGRIVPFSYELKNTPCDMIEPDENYCLFPSGAQEAFPKDELLQEMDVQGYYGTSISISKEDNYILVGLKQSAITNISNIEVIESLIEDRVHSLLRQSKTISQLNLSQKSFSQLTKITPIGILETQDDKVLFSNPSATRILGRSSDELYGATLNDLFPTRIQKSNNEVTEYKNGKQTKFLLLNNAVLDKEKNLCIHTIADVTDQQETQLALLQAKEELEVSNLDLEKRIARRTKKLQEQHDELSNALIKLKMTQAAVVESEKLASLGTLTAGIAHELNNPLNFILNSANLLDESIDKWSKDPMAKELIGYIKEGANRSAEIIRSLNSFSRNASADKETVSPCQIINNCLTVLNHQLKNKAKVTLDYDEKCKVIGNESQLHQVFINLIANAFQAINHDHGRINIRVRNSKDLTIIEIEDNGSGIKPSDIDRIKDPFFTTKKGTKGTGLGLSIVSKIIDEHQGRLEYDSEVGIGTTATVSFLRTD